MTIEISHTSAEGTLVHGTSRADAPTITGLRTAWRWSRRLEAWFWPRSRHTTANRSAIDRLAEALRAAGCTVTVEIDDTYQPMAERHADQVERSTDRAAHLEDKAARLADEAAATLAKARQMAAMIPFGQPMLTDHYSYRSDRNRRDRIHGTFDRGFTQLNDANGAAARAAAVTDHSGQLTSRTYLSNRIAEREATLRDCDRQPESERNAARRLQAADELAFYQGHLAALPATAIDRTAIKPNDLVKIERHGWMLVVSARGAKNIKVSSHGLTLTYSWATVLEHRPVTPEQLAAAEAKAALR